jgi:hypothetical protein
VALQPQDRAVYMGTLRYARDEFFDVRGVEILDDSDRGAADYQRRFAGGPELTSRLVTPSR